MSESVSLCACSTKGGMRAVSHAAFFARRFAPTEPVSRPPAPGSRPTPRHKFAGRLGLDIPPRHANANAVACDTPTTLLAAFAGKQFGRKLHLGEHSQQCGAQVPILGAQFFGFAAGDEKCVPSQHAAVIVLLPRGLQAHSTGRSSVPRLASAMPPIHSSADRFVGHPSAPRRRIPVPAKNETRRWAAPGWPGATGAAIAAMRCASAAARRAATRQPC